MNHNFANVLNFDEQIYKSLDQAVSLFSETYISLQNEYVKQVIHTPKNKIDIYQVQDNYLSNFIQYGLALIDGGINPSFIEILLINAYNVLLDKCADEEKKFLRLQLLYVIQSIKIIYLDKKEFVYFTEHVASTELDKSNIYHYFNI